MKMPEAATEGSKTAHLDPLSNDLVGSPKGSLKVKIDDHSAWRANIDIHKCTKTSPQAHGVGLVAEGSKKVFIDGFPAVRVGDKVTEAAGGANEILEGNRAVIIEE